jgi:PAS domain S-box-containing protein
MCADRVAELEAELAGVRKERDALACTLTQSKQLLSAVYCAPIGIVCVAANGKYVFSNEAHANFLGWPREELVSVESYQRWVEVTHPDDYVRERRLWQQMADGETEGYQIEKRYIRRNGELRWARTAAVALRDGEGRLASFLLYVTDIHEQKMAAEARERLEAELRQAQKLEALGKLAGGVAHDFNNRLVIIMGYAALLQENLSPTSPLAHHVEMVLTSAQRATELTRQLLAYSRRQVLKPQAFDLNGTVDGMRRLLERLIGDDIELVTALGANHHIFSDPGQIEQVILNLSINARDAMPRGGKLCLETRDLTEPVGNLPPGEYVALIVRDTGTGIPDELLPRVFEPFFTTKEMGSGTGLGLSTVEGIVHQSGGAVLVESRVGSGSTFTVYLPRAIEAAVSSKPPVHPTRSRMGFETLLVVDDDDGVRKLVVDVLRQRAYRVLEARNGRHALEVARKHDGPIHLLVTDLVMPELGGAELAAELRRNNSCIRVLYLSGYSDDEALLARTLERGTQFLSKPFLPGDLLNSVRGVLEGTTNSSSSEAAR